MTTNEMNQIVDNLKLQGKEVVIDNAFKYFIDNQISVDELKYILNKLDYELPNDFDKLPIYAQKEYHQHTKRLIKFVDGNPLISEFEIYNKAYFYELANYAKKNAKITESFIRYVCKLDNMALTILSTKYVKLANLSYYKTHKEWQDFAKEKKINNLFDFYMSVMKLNNVDKRKVPLTNQLITFFGASNLYDLDFKKPFVRFAFDVETILTYFSTKVANTIKIKFLVYKKDYLDEKDYSATLDNPRTLINRNKKEFKKKENILIINKMQKYYQDNPIIVNSFNDNGYNAIYYSVLEAIKGE